MLNEKQLHTKRVGETKFGKREHIQKTADNSDSWGQVTTRPTPRLELGTLVLVIYQSSQLTLRLVKD